MKSRREPRPQRPTELPLDDGVREGIEQWRDLNGVQFCHWDRWLLRLALDEPKGLQSIAREFRCRAIAQRNSGGVAETMLAQIADLESRLACLGVAPEQVLDEAERMSEWLHHKAFRRVWHATSIRHATTAMNRTPRKVLEARAFTGYCPAFPVSPQPYLATLCAVLGDGWYDYRGTGLAVMLLEQAGDRLLRDARGDDERLAIHRAMLTASIRAMGQVNDSLDELGQHFRDHEHVYLELLRGYLARPDIIRDLLELVVWEDYGLFNAVEPFLCGLSELHADLAVRDLAKIIAELRSSALDHQLEKAQRLRRVLVAAAERFGDTSSESDATTRDGIAAEELGP